MKIKLLSLTLENFKCHEHLELQLDGKSARIYGENGAGKSSIYDGFTWLLFGRDHHGQADFAIQPTFQEGEQIGKVKDPAAITSVEAVLSVDGIERRLKRTYYEVWSTKRGSAEKSRDGHSSDYFVDDVPVKKNEYVRRVGEMVPEEKFKLLTNLYYFSKQLPWKERRAILFDVAAVATDKEILASDARFAPLTAALQGLSLDDYRKKLTAQRKGLNKTREDVPARLDECKKTMADLAGMDFDALECQRSEAQSKRAEVQRELDQAEHDGGRTELRNQLAVVHNELGRLKNENTAHRLAQQQAQGTNEAAQIRQSLNAIRAHAARRQSDLEYLQGRQKTLKEEIAHCRAQWDAVHQERFQGGICPTCGQPLPQDKLEASKTAFERDKDRRKGEAVDAANRAKTALKSVQEEITKLEQEATESRKQMEEWSAQLQQLESVPKADITDMDGYAAQKAELEAQSAELQERLDGLDQQSASHREALQKALADVDRDLERLSGELARKTALEYANRRMEELRAQAAAASDELNRLDGMLYLCDEFTRYKVEFLTESVKRQFHLVWFQLFREQVNGGLEDCCEVMVKGAAVGNSANTGAEVNAGIDMINTLSRCYGIYVPLFIDNTESVTDLLPADTQVICLEVSKSDNELRCELVNGRSY